MAPDTAPARAPSCGAADAALASREDIMAALDAVPDPELPAVSVVELGMIADVRIAGGRVEVDLIPTFAGCPATELIAADVAAAVAAAPGVDEVQVAFVHSPAWRPERISAAGRRKLAEFGIAPPGSGQSLTPLGRPPLAGVRCPLCGGTDTAADSLFGPTPCRASSYCRDCRNPFEVIKP